MIPKKCKKCDKRGECNKLDDFEAMLLCEDNPRTAKRESHVLFHNPTRSTKGIKDERLL